MCVEGNLLKAGRLPDPFIASPDRESLRAKVIPPLQLSKQVMISMHRLMVVATTYTAVVLDRVDSDDPRRKSGPSHASVHVRVYRQHGLLDMLLPMGILCTGGQSPVIEVDTEGCRAVGL